MHNKQNIDLKKLQGTRLNVTISIHEAALIQTLRKFDYGKFNVEKQAGNPTRIEYLGSVRIDPENAFLLDGIEEIIPGP